MRPVRIDIYTLSTLGRQFLYIDKSMNYTSAVAMAMTHKK